MMRGLVIATNGDMRVQTFTAPALEDVQKVVGGDALVAGSGDVVAH